MSVPAATSYAQQIDAIEGILTKANGLLRELEDRERNLQHYNCNIQSCVAILEEMKHRLVMMIQSFENDTLLSKLLALNDSIDDAVHRLAADSLPSNSQNPLPLRTYGTFETRRQQLQQILEQRQQQRLQQLQQSQQQPESSETSSLPSAGDPSGDGNFETKSLDIWEDIAMFMATNGIPVAASPTHHDPTPFDDDDVVDDAAELDNVQLLAAYQNEDDDNNNSHNKNELSNNNDDDAGDSDGAMSLSWLFHSSSSDQGKKGKDKKSDKKGKISVKHTCKICCEEYDSWYLLHELDNCKHVYCIECLREYYATRINDGNVLNIVCPDPSCKAEVSPNDIKSLVDPSLWEKYDNFVLIASLKQDPNICWCPAPGCSNAILREPTDDPKVACEACRLQFCAECKDQWHDGMTCDEFSKIKERMHKSVAKQSSSFNSWTSRHKREVKPCPHCKAFIEKSEGCNHMTCVSCKFQFCWLCLSEYTANHFGDQAGFPNCYLKQYYTPRPWYKPNVQKDTLVKAGKILGIGAAVVLLGVPAAVIGGPIYGCIRLHAKLRQKRGWVHTNRGWVYR